MLQSGEKLLISIVSAFEHQDKVLKLLQHPSWHRYAAAKNNTILMLAVKSGWSKVVSFLLSLPNVRALAHVNNNAVLTWAIEEGHYDIALTLLKLPNVSSHVHGTAKRLLLSVLSPTTSTPKPASLDLVVSLLQLPNVRAHAHAWDNFALRWAAENHHPKLVKDLLTLPQVRAQAHTGQNHPLFYAAQYGWVDIVKDLLTLDAVRAKVTVNENEIYRFALENNQTPCANLLCKVKSVQEYESSHANPTTCSLKRRFSDYDSTKLRLKIAVKNNDENLVLKLLKDPIIQKNSLFENGYMLRWACEKGYSKLALELLELGNIQWYANEQNNKALELATSNGMDSVVHKLLKMKNVIQKLKDNEFDLLTHTNTYNHNTVLIIINLFNKSSITNLCKCFSMLRKAIMANHLLAVRELLKNPTVYVSTEYLYPPNYETLLEIAVRLKHFDIVLELLKHKSILDFAHRNGNNAMLNVLRVTDYYEDDQREHADTAQLRERIAAILLRLPNVRAIAHENYNDLLLHAAENGWYDIVSNLLTIEAVNANADVNDNQILHSAIRYGHTHVAELLRQVPVVRELERTQPIYERGSLGDIANNRENSMRQLSEQQSKNVNVLAARYATRLETPGKIKKVIAEFKSYLISQYALNPMVLNGITYGIEYQKDLPPEVLQAFYRHPIHLAYRYLSDPNLWMSPEAENVKRNTFHEGTAEITEKDEKLLAALWLAVNDQGSNIPDGYKLDDLKNIFIEKVIHDLARAHNFDKTAKKTKMDSSGLSQVVEVHEDDMEGDKPTCSSGVSQRLVQMLEILLSDYAPEYRPLTEKGMENYFYSQLISGKTGSIFSRLELMGAEELCVLKKALNKKYIELESLTSVEEACLEKIVITSEMLERYVENCHERFTQKRIEEKAEPAPRGQNQQPKATYLEFISYLAKDSVEIYYSAVSAKITQLLQKKEANNNKKRKHNKIPEGNSKKQKLNKPKTLTYTFTQTRVGHGELIDQHIANTWDNIKQMVISFTLTNESFLGNDIASRNMLNQLERFVRDPQNKNNFQGLEALIFSKESIGLIEVPNEGLNQLLRNLFKTLREQNGEGIQIRHGNG